MGRVISTCLQFIDAFSNPSRQAIDGMRRMSREAKKAGKEIQGAGNAIQGAGKGLMQNITAPVLGVGAAALKTSADFENAMAKVSTIADTTKTPLDVLKGKVVDLSNEMGVGVADIAEAQYQAISAGVDTASSIEFVSTAIKAAKGGFTDATTAVDGLTTVLNAYSLKADKATEISNQMLMAQNYGKTSFGDMASSMGKVIPIASTLNVSTKELFSSVAVLTKNGIATSEAVTGLKAAYSNIMKPSSDAAKVAKSIGLEFSSAHLQSVGWAGFLEEIKVKTNGNAETMAKLFGSTEALNSVLVLAGKGSADFSEALTLMEEAGGATQAAYEKMLTPTERMNISLNKIKNSLIQFGTALTPAFGKVAEVIGKAGDKLNNLSGAQVESILKWAGIGAAIGPCIMVFGKAVTGVGAVVSVFGKISGAITKAGSIMALLTSPAAIVIGVLAGIAAAGVLVYKNWGKLKPVFMSVMNVAKAAATNMGKSIKNVMVAVTPVVQALMAALSAALPKVIEGMKAAIKTISPVIKIIVGVVSKAVPIIAITFVGALKKLSPVVKTVGNIIKSVAPVIKNLLAGAFSFIGKTITKVMPQVNKIAQAVGGVLLHALSKASPVVIRLADTFSAAFTGIYNIVKGIVKKLQPVFGLIGTIVKSVMGIVEKTIDKKFHSAADIIETVAGNIKQIIDGVIKVFDGVITFVTGVFTGNWRKAWEGVKNIFGGAFEALVGLCKIPLNSVINVINRAIEGINGLSVDIPEGVPFVGGKHFGFSIPTIPALAEGTQDWRGGIAQGNEKGGEIIDLPKGSRVYPHDQSVQMARKSAMMEMAAMRQVVENLKGVAERKMVTTRQKAVIPQKMADRGSVAPRQKLAILEKTGHKGSAAQGNGRRPKKLTEKGGVRSITIKIPKLADSITIKDERDIGRLTDELARKLVDTAKNMGVA